MLQTVFPQLPAAEVKHLRMFHEHGLIDTWFIENRFGLPWMKKTMINNEQWSIHVILAKHIDIGISL
jgi:hypothetical protein